jgi:LmbE family N-acetylglucosaminyl deacetylase
MKRKILIIVAHTDDETLGCGCAIQWHNEVGDTVYAMSFTDGVSSRDLKKRNLIIKRRKQSDQVSNFLNFKWVKRLNFPDNKLDSIPLLKFIKIIEKIKKKINPDIIYTHHPNDINIDHQKIYNSVIVAFRPEVENNLKEIRLVEIPSSTEYGIKKNLNFFVPNIFINSKKYYQKKIKAFNFYKNEIKKYPYSRSLNGLKNLMKSRGNQVSMEYAECFELFRKIIK